MKRLKRYEIAIYFVALFQGYFLASANNMGSKWPSNLTVQQTDIYSRQHLINRAAKLFYCIPDHARVSPDAKPYMTDELYFTLEKAWDIPSWGDGPGEEEFLLYFVTGNGNGSIGNNSAISGTVLSTTEKTCQVRIYYKEYEEGYGYSQDAGHIDILMCLQEGDWVMADFGLGYLKECKHFIKKQVEDYQSGEIVRIMRSAGFCDQKDIDKVCREFDSFIKLYGTNENGGIATMPYNETSNPPTFKGEGLNGFTNWVLGKTIYPEYCKEEGIQGDITVRFTVDENGFVIDESIVKSVEPSLDAEALRVITTSPKWNVGKYNSNDVRTVIELTIPFRLSESSQTASYSKPTASRQTTSYSQPAASSQTSSYFQPSFSQYNFSTHSAPKQKTNIKTDDKAILGVVIPDPYNVEEAQEEEFEKEPIPFQLVEEKPSFEGGDANNFSKWVNQRLVYPEVAKENGVQGRVMLQFTINTDGSVSNVKVLRGVDPSLDKEAVRVVSQSPRWTPGMQHGKKVMVTYTFPVIFQLR